MVEMVSWGGRAFERIAALDPQRGSDGSLIELMPQSRYAKAAISTLNRYGRGPFCKFSIPWSHQGAGVYVITVEGRTVYVGECEHLAKRFNMGYGTIQPKNCYVGGQATNCKVNALVLREVKAGRAPVLWFHPTEDRKSLEARLIAELRPMWNGRI
jgi:hypothetical protein